MEAGLQKTPSDAPDKLLAFPDTTPCSRLFLQLSNAALHRQKKLPILHRNACFFSSFIDRAM
jgi:hypothetical protein